MLYISKQEKERECVSDEMSKKVKKLILMNGWMEGWKELRE